MERDAILDAYVELRDLLVAESMKQAEAMR
jgi:hypothetical protein